MPRRIRLDFAPNAQGLACDLTGVVEDVIVTGWRQRPNGVKYVAFDHPLSPYYKDTKGGWLPVHPQPGGIGYRHWVGLALDSGETGGRRRAACVSTWHARARKDVTDAVRDGTRLLAGGYDMKDMKARAFIESEMPLPGTGDTVAQQQLAPLARGLVGAAEIAAGALRLAIRDAVLDRDAPIGGGTLAAAFEGFWAATQEPFFAALRSAADTHADADDPQAALKREAGAWQDGLRRTALALFDEAAPLDPSAASFDYARIVAARRNLIGTLKGYGALGYQLVAALGLPDPGAGRKAKRKRKGGDDAH